MFIINLTQHAASAEQAAAGVVDLPNALRSALSEALTFEELPSSEEVKARAETIAELACDNGLGADDSDDPIPQGAMIGGALWLMRPLADELEARGIQPLFAFSKRESVETNGPDGAIVKTAVFRHLGFVPA